MDFITGETLYIDKPLKWTSFDVVKRIRGALQHRLGRRIKVGHAGTLDPLATGVMAVCTGRNTKLIDTLQADVKEYVAEITLGATTPSFDLETPVDATYPTAHITRSLIESVLPQFRGTISQIPPAFSACKVDGKRAYKMARQGKDPGLKPKTLVIDEIEILEFDDMRLTIRVVCSKGTYIRALARDIGAALSSGGHLTALRRTRVGDTGVNSCLTVNQALELIKTVEITMPDETPVHPEADTQQIKTSQHNG